MNLDKLKEELQNEILWRYKELKNIKILYDKHTETKKIQVGTIQKEIKQNTAESKYILRSSIPMIYAHWEGYFKKSIDILNENLDRINISYNKINTMLLATLMKDKHSIENNKKILLFSEIICDTQSNLKWKILEKFVHTYGFKESNYKKYSQDIDDLIKIRNGISHGENAYHFENIDKINYFLVLVIKLMIITKINIIRSVEYKLFYKN